MAFVEPAPEDFVDRYPEFVNFDYDWVATVLDQAVHQVDGTWIESDRYEAIYAYTAHVLYSATLPGASAGSGAGTSGTTSETVGPLTVATSGGQIVQETVGPLTVRYAEPIPASEMSSYWGSWDTTRYGAYYETLLKRSHPAVAIV